MAPTSNSDTKTHRMPASAAVPTHEVQPDRTSACSMRAISASSVSITSSGSGVRVGNPWWTPMPRIADSSCRFGARCFGRAVGVSEAVPGAVEGGGEGSSMTLAGRNPGLEHVRAAYASGPGVYRTRKTGATGPRSARVGALTQGWPELRRGEAVLR
jgi:hypothetical protein